MKNFLKEYKWLILALSVSFAIFYPSLFVFFTNDDFFFLKISNAKTVGEFFNFFNILHGPDGWGVYRPLATQTFYFISVRLFDLSPMPLHIISFLFFGGVVFLVHKLVKELTGNKEANIAVFLYAVNATHFGHLYYLAVFQELAMTFFVLHSVLFFVNYLKKQSLKNHVFSLLFFVAALMSKETAVVAPFLLILVFWFLHIQGKSTLSFKKFIFFQIPYYLILALYLFMHFVSYGLAGGDSYIWDFSVRRLINTLGWYGLWSFNLPESLIDFVGPGLHINPNLFVFWSKEITPIFVLSAFMAVILVYMFWGLRKKISYSRNVFALLWFLVSLVPVAFLPLHKFTFYLTLPLIGVAFLLSDLLKNSILKLPFLIIWAVVTVYTVRFTVITNWITQGESVSKKVYSYLSVNTYKIDSKKIYFVDSDQDKSLPWSPTQLVKTALSDKNFFFVYFPAVAGNVYYAGEEKIPNRGKAYIINSRMFLNY